jgi:hypothetical protein
LAQLVKLFWRASACFPNEKIAAKARENWVPCQNNKGIVEPFLSKKINKIKQVIDVILSFLFYCLRHGATFHAVDLLELLQWPNLTSTIFPPQLLPFHQFHEKKP